MKCLITGAGGFLGSNVKTTFVQKEWETLELSRRPGTVPFRLGEPVTTEALAGADALIHCAYDFTRVSRSDIWRVNVDGSRMLFDAAARAKVSKLIFISTISAFEGCRSLYGQAKLQIEAIAREHGALVLRPGLIYGDSSGGMFGKLVAQVKNSKLIPLIGDGSQIQYLVHEEDLCRLIFDFANGSLKESSNPVTAAHPCGWTFREILEAIAADCGRKPIFLPLPWRLMWAGLRGAELLQLPLGFRSDSIVSLMNQNPHPVFAPDLGFRPFGTGRPGSPLHAA